MFILTTLILVIGILWLAVLQSLVGIELEKKVIDPVTIGLALQGVKLVVSGIKAAADEAKEAFDSINDCVESGKNLAQSLAPVTKFFSAAGKYETSRAQLEEAKAAQEEAIERGETVADHISDAEYVMELMAIDRQIKQYYGSPGVRPRYRPTPTGIRKVRA